MPVTVKVNGASNSLVHKGSSGISAATMPDVCKTPSPGGPVPIPYPNVSQSATLSKGTTTVKADGGMMIAHKPSEFSVSNGDNPGVAGGVKSGTFMKESTWILYSFDVKMEGQGACRLTDKKFQNHGNTVDLAGVQQLNVFVEGNPALNLLCNIFCEAREKARKAGGRFNGSEEAKKLAKGKYADNLAKHGMQSEASLLMRTAKGTAEKLGRKLYSAQAVMDRAKRKAAEMVGKKLASTAARRVVAKFIPIVNVVSLAIDIYDGATLAKEAYDMVSKAMEGYDVVRVKPDIATFNPDGSVKEIHDFKFDYPSGGKDKFRDGQRDLYTELGDGARPKEVSMDTCAGCQSKGTVPA